MRTRIIIILLMVIIVGIALISNTAINSFCLGMLDLLEEARISILAEDWQSAAQTTESIKQSLTSSRSWITMLINQRMLNEIEIIAERLQISVELEDQLASMAELVSLKSFMEEVQSDTFITLTNLL